MAELRTSNIPGRVLSCDCQVWVIIPHFHQTQFNQPRHMSPVDHPRAFCSNILERPSEINRIKTKLRKRIIVGFHSYFNFRPDRVGLLSVILLLQNNPDHEDQSGDDADQNSWILRPFQNLHFAFAFGPASRASLSAFRRLRFS
jgi:hypothetical protein